MSLDGIDSVVGKTVLFMCRIASLFLLQRLKGTMLGEARVFNNMETRALLKVTFFLARVDVEEISRHSDRNISATCTTVCQSEKLGGPV